VHGLILRYFLVIWIRVFHRAVFDTGGAARTLLLDNVAGFLLQGDREIALGPCYRIDFSERQNLYVWMPADLDQFR